MAATLPFAYLPAYHTSKGGLENFVREGGRIRALTILAGWGEGSNSARFLRRGRRVLSEKSAEC